MINSIRIDLNLALKRSARLFQDSDIKIPEDAASLLGTQWSECVPLKNFSSIGMERWVRTRIVFPPIIFNKHFPGGDTIGTDQIMICFKTSCMAEFTGQKIHVQPVFFPLITYL